MRVYAVVDLYNGRLSDVKLFDNEEKRVAYLTTTVIPQLEEELGSEGVAAAEALAYQPEWVMHSYLEDDSPFWRRWYAMRDTLVDYDKVDWDVYAQEYEVE